MYIIRRQKSFRWLLSPFFLLLLYNVYPDLYCFLCVILKNRESETIMASHPPLPSRSSCLLADIVLLNHVEREE